MVLVVVGDMPLTVDLVARGTQCQASRRVVLPLSTLAELGRIPSTHRLIFWRIAPQSSRDVVAVAGHVGVGYK